jgi:hypothetical protein
MQSQESVGFLRDFLRLPLSMQIEILTLRHLPSAAARKSSGHSLGKLGVGEAGL